MCEIEQSPQPNLKSFSRNPSRAISENDLRIYSPTSSSNEEEEEKEEEEEDGGGGLDRERRYSKKAGPERGRREESVEDNTEDEQSSRWDTDNRLVKSLSIKRNWYC